MNPSLKEYSINIWSAIKNCEADVEKAIDLIREVREKGRTLWILGNGGSLSIAQHLAQDLIKMRGMKAQTISCPSILTAVTNDVSFEDVYSLPLEILREEGDGILIFSCSGSSRNYANIVKRGWKPLISVVGTNGGLLKEASDVCIHVTNDNYQLCESGFNIIADLINFKLEE